MYFIPIPDGPDTVQTLLLDGNQYTIRIRWNTRSEMWHIYFGGIGEDYSCKIPITVGFDLLAPYIGLSGVPDGRLLAIDINKSYGRIGRDDFKGTTSRFRLLYRGEDE